MTPGLYVALGISGQVQHLAGIKGAKVVVSVNNDARAPITRNADYVIVGDLYKVVPELVSALDEGAAGVLSGEEGAVGIDYVQGVPAVPAAHGHARRHVRAAWPSWPCCSSGASCAATAAIAAPAAPASGPR